jgi:hypothetical protein
VLPRGATPVVRAVAAAAVVVLLCIVVTQRAR